MHRLRATLLLIIAGVLVMRDAPAGQGNQLTNARASHVGVVVPDIETAIGEYVRVMGFPAVKSAQPMITMPDGSTAQIKSAGLRFSNFAVELVQPVSPAGPYHRHLQAYGMSVQHLGLVVPGQGSVDEVRRALEQQGGRRIYGPDGGTYADIDFLPTLGTTTIELNRGSSAVPQLSLSAAPGDALPPLAALKVTHVGFGASDVAQVSSGFAKLLGIAAPKVNEYKDAQYPPDAKWSKSAYLRIAFLNHDPIGVGLEFIESVGGPTPWSEFIRAKKGTAVQHLAINVGDKMDEYIRDLVAKGGKWTNGKPGGGYAYLDFSNTLGLVFELNGTSRSATTQK